MRWFRNRSLLIHPRRITGIMLVLALTLAGVLTPALGSKRAAAQDLRLESARAAILLDATTGQSLYEHEADQRIPPASLAKIMTMYLVLDAVDAGELRLDQTVEISERAWRLAMQGGGISAMFIEVGDQVRIEDLLYGVGVSSGNDAALALAEAVAGSEEAFVRRMNETAKTLGMNNTMFVDSHGLSEDAYTTARDMALLSAAFVRNHHDGLRFANQLTYEYNGIPQPNRNGLLRRDERVTGLKTGFLSVAGYHLAATAEDGDMSLVAVVMGAASIPDRENEALQLLDYGFQNFRTLTPAWNEPDKATLPVYKGKSKQVTVRPAQPIVVTVPADAANDWAWDVSLPPHLEAPLAQGEEVGTLTLLVAGSPHQSVPLVTVEAVERAGIFSVLWDSIRLLFMRLVDSIFA